MLDSIISNLKSQVGSELLGKAGISKNMLDPLLKETGDVVGTEVKKEALSNGLSSVMNLFSNNQNNAAANNLQNNIASNLVKNYITKLGLSESQANMVSQIVLPKIMGLITQTNNQTSDSDPSPLQSLFDLAGGDGGEKKGKGGMGGMLGGLLGSFTKK